MGLYTELAKRDQFSQSVGNGLGLILAGFARPEDKESIIEGLAGGSGSDSLAGGGGSDPMSMLSSIMKFQADRTAAQQKAADRANIPAIAKQYGLDEKTATYLFDAGTLDTVIGQLAKPNKQLTEGADGRHYIVDITTGSISDPLGPAKPRETEVIEDANTGRKFAVYKDTKQPVGGKDLVPGQRKTEFIDDPSGKGGKVLVYSDDRTPVAGGPAITNIAAPPKKVVFQEDGKGGKIAMYEDGTRIPDKDIPGLGATEKEQLYNASKKNWEKMGKDPKQFPDLETWVTLHEANSSTRMSVDVGGNELPKPPEGFAWKHGPDGKVPYDENGAPIAVPIGGTKQAQEAADAGKVDATKDLNAAVGGTIVGQEVNRALDNVMANKDNWVPTTGMGSLLSFIPGTPQKQLDQSLTTIRSNVTKDALQAMRAANPTGAAFGNVSDFEDKLMQATVGSLDPAGKPEDVVYNLRRIQALYGAIITGHIKDEAEAKKILNSVRYPTPEEMRAEYKSDFDPTQPDETTSGKSLEDPTLDEYVKKYKKAK